MDWVFYPCKNEDDNSMLEKKVGILFYLCPKKLS